MDYQKEEFNMDTQLPIHSYNISIHNDIALLTAMYRIQKFQWPPCKQH